MAAPTAPTLTSLTTESLKRAGYSSPSSAMLTRAADWMEEIKNDILVLAGGRKLKSLHTVSATVTTNGKSRYSNPTDYFSDMTMQAIFGSVIGTAAGGSASSFTLASGHGQTESDLLGKEAFIYSGTGVGSLSQCTSLSGDAAGVSPNFTTAPTSGSKYMIIERYVPLKEEPIWNRDNNSTIARGEPCSFMPIGDVDYGEFELYPVPYNTTAPYGLKMRYYANLMTLDLAGTLVATLYQRWRNVWVQGVLARALEDKSDARANQAMSVYRNLVMELVAREIYGADLSNLTCVVSDY